MMMVQIRFALNVILHVTIAQVQPLLNVHSAHLMQELIENLIQYLINVLVNFIIMMTLLLFVDNVMRVVMLVMDKLQLIALLAILCYLEN